MDEHGRLALRELERFSAILADASNWSVATPCDQWDVEALARHVAAVAWQQAEAVHRGRAHVLEAPSWLSAAGDRDQILVLLAEAVDHLRSGLRIDERATVPLPFAPLPAPVAISALVMEYGVHRADLERSLLGAPQDTLDAEVARVVAALLRGFLPLLAEKPHPTPITFRLRGESATVSITYENDGWHPGEGSVPICEIGGSDAAISLLALGRIGVDHPALSTNDAAAASMFSDHIRRI